MIETVTENLSITGFFCFSEAAFRLGELTTCAIHIPKYLRGEDQVLTLLCQATVVRVERAAMDGKIGTAFHIEKYQCCQADPGLHTPPLVNGTFASAPDGTTN